MTTFHTIFDPPAWRKKFNIAGDGVRVAVLDTGIDLSNAGLAKQIKAVRDITHPGANGMDTDGHGTQLAGMISAVAPSCELVIGKMMHRSGFFTYNAFCDSLRWSIREGAQLICVASGEQHRDAETERLLKSMCESNNTIILAAMGNYGGNSTNSGFYPARYKACLAVGTIDNDLRLATFTDQNPDVRAIYAPGVDIVVPDLDGLVVTSGTSISAAYATGVLALGLSRLMKRHGNFQAKEFKDMVFQTAFQDSACPVINPWALYEELGK